MSVVICKKNYELKATLKWYDLSQRWLLFKGRRSDLSLSWQFVPQLI